MPRRGVVGDFSFGCISLNIKNPQQQPPGGFITYQITSQSPSCETQSGEIDLINIKENNFACLSINFS